MTEREREREREREGETNGIIFFQSRNRHFFIKFTKIMIFRNHDKFMYSLKNKILLKYLTTII